MITLSKKIEGFIGKMVSRETDPINQARVRMLFYLLVAYAVFGLTLMFAYFYNYQFLKLIRASTIFFFSSLFIVFMYYANVWRALSHAVLILMTLLGAWGNLLIFVHGINAATLQYIWMASALGFFMKGPRWGWFYSTLNSLPVIIDVAFTDKDYFLLKVAPEVVVKPVYVYVLLFDFFLITFLHYFFFKAYSKNINNLTQTKNELKETNLKLNDTIQSVNELSNARMEFLSTMSHELRTPLNGVIGLTNALIAQSPRKDQEETLSVLRFSAENLLHLINDILDLNKLDSEKMELEYVPFNLNQLVKNIYASIKVKAVEKHIDIQLHLPEELHDKYLYGDPTRLTQVLLNLLNNAIKFTEKGIVSVSCEILNQTNDKVKIRFVVEDTGIGIEENQQEKVFEAFVQASPSISRHYGGTGLGLSIVKKVLALYNTTITLESKPSEGTRLTFDIEFPYTTVLLVPSYILPETVLTGLSNLKVLVVEDNAVNVLVMKKTLEQQNIKPDIAENGKIALDKVTSNNYDIVFMDLFMPEMDGYETTKKIRELADKTKSSVPIIALTATVNDKVINEVLSVGMDGYIAKPFRPEDLFGQLRKVMGR